MCTYACMYVYIRMYACIRMYIHVGVLTWQATPPPVRLHAVSAGEMHSCGTLYLFFCLCVLCVLRVRGRARARMHPVVFRSIGINELNRNNLIYRLRSCAHKVAHVELDRHSPRLKRSAHTQRDAQHPKFGAHSVLG